MANKTLIKKILIYVGVFVLGFLTAVLIFTSTMGSTNDFSKEKIKYEERIKSLHISFGQAIQTIEQNDIVIDSLEQLVDSNEVLLTEKLETIDSLEYNRKQLKELNHELLSQTIHRINTSPSYLDSLRRKHFGG